MKLIDLLNKIANCEEVPKMIIYNKEKYCKFTGNYTYWKEGSKESNTLNIDTYDLNDEVEIIDESELLNDKKELYDRIQRAIEYIESCNYGTPGSEELLDILRGKENE